jgi:CheY-like chemotaxis protein
MEPSRNSLYGVAEHVTTDERFRQLQKLEVVGRLAGGVAHDFNNLLTVVLGNVEVLEGAMERAGIDTKLTKRLGYMRNAAERGARLTSQLLAFSRRQRLEPKACDLNEIVSNMQDLLQSTIGGSIRINTRLEPRLSTAMVDPTQLELAVLNLAINARDAMGVGGALSVATANVTLGPPARPEEPQAGDYVSICVTDTGSGMSEDVRQKVFEPFFTTKEIGKGSGLGLSQVLGFAQQSGGGVRLRSRLGRGTSVFIYLPQTQAHPGTARRSSRMRAASDGLGGEHILLVDDDAGVREVTATLLRGLGYTVYEAGSGGAALERLQSPPHIDLVLIDFAMPGMSGADVVRRLRATHPSLPTVFITGFADRTALADISDTHIIGKPFHPDELAGKVRAALSSFELGHSAN